MSDIKWSVIASIMFVGACPGNSVRVHESLPSPTFLPPVPSLPTPTHTPRPPFLPSANALAISDPPPHQFPPSPMLVTLASLMLSPNVCGPCVSSNGGLNETHGAAFMVCIRVLLFLNLVGSIHLKRSAHDISLGLGVSILSVNVSPFFTISSPILPRLPLLRLLPMVPPPWDDACAEAVVRRTLLVS